MSRGIETYPLRGQNGHTGDHPSTLTRAKSKSLLDIELVHDLQGHDGSVPVGEVLDRTAGGAVAERLDGQQVDGIRQRLAVELVVVERDGCAHGVDEDDGGLGGVDLVPGKAVAGRDATEVGDLDGGCGCHDVICVCSSFVPCCSAVCKCITSCFEFGSVPGGKKKVAWTKLRFSSRFERDADFYMY